MIHRPTHYSVLATGLFYSLSLSAVAAEPPVIRFDLPATTAASPIDSSDPSSPVEIELKLSSMIASPNVPRIDQWLVRCEPRDGNLTVADYAPRTEVGSDIGSPINVKQTDEKTDSFGLSLDGSYGHLARAHGGADHSTKNSESVQYDRLAPVQAVTASGTIRRGRGVYFKLRWTSQQVLEGEKSFRITLNVPPTWRGGLIDVSVLAQAERQSFAGLDREVKTLGSARFVVAAYRESDREAKAMAMKLARAEHRLREAAREKERSSGIASLPALLKKIVAGFDFGSGGSDDEWIERLMHNEADPHIDEQINRLPVSVRVAVLDYCETRRAFSAIAAPEDSTQLVANRSDG